MVKTPLKGVYRDHIGSLLQDYRLYIRSFDHGSYRDVVSSSEVLQTITWLSEGEVSHIVSAPVLRFLASGPAVGTKALVNGRTVAAKQQGLH